MTTVLLAGDEPAALRVLVALLRQAGYDVLGDGVPLDAAVEAVRTEQPDLAIVDMPSAAKEKVDRIRLLVEAQGHRPVVVVSTHDVLAGGGLLEVGAAICIARDHVEAGFLGAVEAARAVVPAIRNDVAAPAAHGAELTPREREILWLLRAGSSTKEIASVLGLSVRTVDFHRANIKHKLQLRSGAELIAFASRSG